MKPDVPPSLIAVLQEHMLVKEIFPPAMEAARAAFEKSLADIYADLEKISGDAKARIEALKRSFVTDIATALLEERLQAAMALPEVVTLEGEKSHPEVDRIIRDIMGSRPWRESKTRKLLGIFVRHFVAYGSDAEPLRLEKFRHYLEVKADTPMTTCVGTLRYSDCMSRSEYEIQSVQLDPPRKEVGYRLVQKELQEQEESDDKS